ncbi:Ca-activated chloride channel family protein [Kibdelosporangium banguiense]|uniref:Ca-activated chloride channel family protein n=1 Tax=Kibdelosporangium banguiense TaxID=1365924 RepID=A0ABS4T5U4_9PSEU|nr:VWA domain-containing protein [Kibdelosporangium banguiense]MBP2319840.1 Ca-activated chloride channel family protein [Kibdelosporangium banguiense]
MRKLVALGLVLALAGCDSSTTPDPAQPLGPPKPGTLRILAGSELADMKPILDQAAQATGVTATFTFSGTLEGAEQLARGDAAGKFDAVWFSSNRYLQSLPEANKRLGNQVKIMNSPVLLGLSSTAVRRLGWENKRVSWSEIAEAAGNKAFTYGMTDPSASNSGFSALVGVASALAGTGSAVTPDQIASVSPALTKFFAGQALSAGSSGWLSEAYQRRATGADAGQKVDGLINYESVLLSMNADGKLPEPLSLVYPSDGVVSADYPLTLLSDANNDARDAHQRLSDYLRTPDVQRKIMDTTRRRPAIPGIGDFSPKDLVELPFPAGNDAIDALLSAYFNKIRRPSRTLYVLDVSGSMQGERIESLRSALIALTGADGSLIGKYRGFRGREEVTLLPFASTPGAPETFTVPESAPQAELDRIKATASNLKASGGTAIYDSLLRGYQLLGQPSPDRFTSIVLMTDGENQNGSPLGAFEAAQPRLAKIPVFTVLFGEGSPDEMNRVAALTGGQVFDARNTPLAKVFQEVRGYQ